jgi:hypothetical protein
VKKGREKSSQKEKYIRNEKGRAREGMLKIIRLLISGPLLIIQAGGVLRVICV